jgi:hypothetical protein
VKLNIGAFTDRNMVKQKRNLFPNPKIEERRSVTKRMWKRQGSCLEVIHIMNPAKVKIRVIIKCRKRKRIDHAQNGPSTPDMKFYQSVSEDIPLVIPQ